MIGYLFTISRAHRKRGSQDKRRWWVQRTRSTCSFESSNKYWLCSYGLSKSSFSVRNSIKNIFERNNEKEVCSAQCSLYSMFLVYWIDWIHFNPKNKKIKWKIFRIEPVGSVAPKVNLADELSIARVAFGQTLNIACPAQSFPVPAFR